MSRLEHALRQIARVLGELDAGWALVGGLAVSVRTEPRFTRDVDIAVAVSDDAEAETLVRDLVSRGYGVEMLVEQQATRRLATARLTPPGQDAEGVVVDLLFASSGIEPEIVAAAESVEVAGTLEVPVARDGHLIATKLLSEDERRPTDRADLVALVRTADTAELERARRAVELIADRGYQRGRDLPGALDAVLADG